MKIIDKKLLLVIGSIFILLSQITCGNDSTSNTTDSIIPDKDDTNSANSDPIVTPTAKNQTEIQDKNKFNIEIWRSDIENRSRIGENYTKFITLKEELYITPFKKFNNKYSPENDDYKDQIHSLGTDWFYIAGLTGLLFIVYVVLNKFFGKFRGSKKENLDEDFKYWAWGVFSNN